jgi:hypothetical protein
MASRSTFTYAQMAKAGSASPAKTTAPALSPVAARQEALRKAEEHLAVFNAQMASDALSREKQRDNNAAWTALKAADKAHRTAIGVTPAYIGALSKYYQDQRQLSKLRLVLKHQASQCK